MTKLLALGVLLSSIGPAYAAPVERYEGVFTTYTKFSERIKTPCYLTLQTTQDGYEGSVSFPNRNIEQLYNLENLSWSFPKKRIYHPATDPSYAGVREMNGNVFKEDEYYAISTVKKGVGHIELYLTDKNKKLEIDGGFMYRKTDFDGDFWVQCLGLRKVN